MHLFLDILREWEAILAPDSGILAGRVPLVAGVEVMISCFGLPNMVVFVPVEGRACVHESVKGNKIAHGGHSVVENDVHIPPMYFGYQIPPVLNRAVMAI